MSVWVIYSEDGVELGRGTAILAKTAFLLWHKPPPKRLEGIETSTMPDGSYRIEYGGKVFIIRKRSDP